MVAFKELRIKKGELGKYPKTYENRENVNFEEQKPILIDDFRKEEEEELKQKIESRKQKRCAVAEKNKELKQKQTNKKNRLKILKKKKILWAQLNVLNKEIAAIKQKKKSDPKLAGTILK